MAITTQDGLVQAIAAGQKLDINKQSMTSVAGRAQSLWMAAGLPAAGAVPTGSTLNGVIPDSSTTGAFANWTNTSGGTTGYLGHLVVAAGQTGMLVIFDRLWHDVLSSTLTTAQAPTQPALTRPDALGNQTELWLEVFGVMGAGTPSVQATYTNPSGTTGHLTVAQTLPATMAQGNMINLPLQAGDTGVKAVTSYTANATMTSGTIGLVILRRLAEIPIAAANGAAKTGFNFADLGMPTVPDSACLSMMFIPSTTSTGAIIGSQRLIQG